MGTRSITSILVAGLAGLAGCGGSGEGKQGEVADLFVELAGDQGITLDRDCVEEEAGDMSDADAAAIVEAGSDGSPEMSPEASEIAARMLRCFDAGTYLDSVVEQFENDGSVDTACLREQLGGLDSALEIEDRALDAALACRS